jgi:isopentenyl phosphate kinase
MGYDTVVLKVGGSVITDRDADEPTPRKAAMHRTADEITAFDGDLVLVHGAGSYGHPQVKRSDLRTGVDTKQDRLDLARIQRLQNELNVLYTEILQEHGVPAFPLQPSAFLTMNGGELVDTKITVIHGLLELGLVPVLYGVPAHDLEQDVSVLSGDVLAPFIADEIDAERVLHATDVDGVYDRHPDEDDAALLDELDHLPEHVSEETGTANVTGGMRGKLEQLFAYGVCGQIFTGEADGNIRRALTGESVGTLIKPEPIYE